MKKYIIFCTSLLSVVAFAQPSQPTAAGLQSGLCPSISQIAKNPAQGNWTAQTKVGFWKTYDRSFATDLTQFVGAQWVGENVGQLTCVYTSEQRFKMEGQLKIEQTLPQMLVFHTLTFKPVGGKWQRAKHGVYNCHSSTRSDCPFAVNIKPPVGNVIQEAESLKTDAPKKLVAPIN